jgi:tetratricopeptide (TPR) repeat protein
MAPEQAHGVAEQLDERSDVFSLGAILCEILTDKPPYVGDDSQALLRRARRADLADAFARLDGCGADPELVALARRCLAPEPAERPANADEVARIIEAHRIGVEERARQAEVERAAAQARAMEARATAHQAEHRAAAERRARRLTLGLAATALLLVLAGGSGAWLLQRQQADARARRQQAEQQTRQALDEGRKLLKAGWQDNDAARLTQAAAEADKALEFARGASADVRSEAAALHAEVQQQRKQADRNAALLAALLDVITPRETEYEPTDKGTMAEVAQPSMERQFALAFRRWDRVLDIDRTPLETLAARLGAQPAVVVQEVVAALDAWMLHRHAANQPEPRWRRLFDLADRLDRDPGSRELRRLQVSGKLEREKAVNALVPVLLPWATLAEARAATTQRLRELAETAGRSRQPVRGLVALARALEDVGEAAAAERLLRAALAVQPDQVVLLHALGKLVARQEPPRWAETIECYRAARALRPSLGIALGLALVRGGRPVEAEAIFRVLNDRRPGNPEMPFYLGIALDAQKRLAEAEAAYRESLALQPDDPLAHNNLGVVLFAQKRYQAARAAFQRAVELEPDDPDKHYNLGNALRHLKRYAEAEAAYNKALELKPSFAAAYVNLSSALQHQKRYKEAEAACRKALALKPNSGAAYNNLGVALRAQKRSQWAEAAFRKSLALNPDHPLTHFNLGMVLDDQGQFREAEAAYRKCIALQHDAPVAHYYLGVLLRAQKRYAEAEAAFKTSIELQPNSAMSHLDLGNLLRDQKRYAEAEAAYRKAVTLRPVIPEAYVTLGNLLGEQKRYAEAEAAYKQAIKLKPNSYLAHYNLGNALRDQGRHPEAEAAYRKTIELRPDYHPAHNNLGNALCAQGKLGEAVAVLRRADQLFPNQRIIRANLARTERLLHLESRLAAVQAGQAQPKDARERLALGIFCADHKRQYVAAAGFLSAAFAADPRLVADPSKPYRYLAARSAVLAAAGKGTDAGELADRQRADLRKQALGWLRADLDANTTLAGEAEGRPAVRRRLALWLRDAGLAGVREEKSLGDLPEPERKEWRKLWADVQVLLKKVEQK